MGTFNVDIGKIGRSLGMFVILSVNSEKVNVGI